MSEYYRTSDRFQEDPCRLGDHDFIEVNKRTKTWTEKESVDAGEVEVWRPSIGGSTSEWETKYETYIVKYEADEISYKCRNCGARDTRVEDSREVCRRKAFFQ